MGAKTLHKQIFETVHEFFVAKMNQKYIWHLPLVVYEFIVVGCV